MYECPYLVGPGWWPMLDEYLEEARKAVPDVEVEAKEKYGRCDVFFSTEADDKEALYMIEDKIMRQSIVTCKNCGKPGRLRKERSWVQALCDKCAGADTKERREILMATMNEYFQNR